MVRLDDIIEKVSLYNAGADLDALRKAYVFSAKVHQGQVRLSGEPYLTHPMEVAAILVELKMDVPSIVTGLLHDTIEDTLTTSEELRSLFGEEVADLVDGVTKIGKITFRTSEERQAENFRKMLLAMARDIRVILVKLADRLHNMRTLEFQLESRRRRIAQETLDIYAPLANRLGISWLKSELEDLSFRYLHPEVFRDLASRVSRRRKERQKYVEDVKKGIQEKLREQGIVGDVSGRSKHLYSIFLKMERQGIDFDQVYDLIAFRIIVESVRECYAVLGIIHSSWKPIPGRFKDYIAMPKANMYQSLHTTVIGPFGERMEVQIRTPEMHSVAEEGIAAHWKYKEKGSVAAGGDDKRFGWLRQLLEWQQELKDSREFMDTVKVDLFPEEVYVFTPRGDVKELPKGSTPVDFAYSVHTDIGPGSCCR
jgi:GTP pyrophosphokinase